MKKIVQLSAIDSTMNTGLKELNKKLLEEKYQVFGICSPGSNSEEIKKDGINLVNVNIDRKIGISNIKSIYNLKKELQIIKPEIIHVHTPIASVLARIAAKWAGVPHVIYTAHGFYFHENMSRLKYNIYFYIEKFMAKYFTDYIFTQSQEDATLAINKNFLPINKILCIGNGVDVETKFNPDLIKLKTRKELYEEFSISQDDFIITYVGRLVQEKGIFELLEAFKKIDTLNVKLLIIGENAQHERDNTTPDKLEEYRKLDNVIFTGRRKDVNNILAISDVFCLPSYREGMPRSIIEAMAMENAVIATNIRGSREEVVNDVTGYLIPLYDSESLRIKIKKLIENKTLLESMKIEGRKRALELYNEEFVVSKQLKVFNKLIGTKIK